MKILATALTVLALLGSGATAFACGGMKASTQQQTAQDDPVLYPPPAKG